MILSDEQVGGAVVVEVSGDDGARILELNFVEANVGADVFEPIRPQVAEQAHFAFAVFRLAYRDEINPAIVVVVEGGDSESADPVCFGRSEEHTSELQSHSDLVCRLL